MTQTEFHDLAVKLLDQVGGEGNVSSVKHCMSRLRFVLKDDSLASDDEIKADEGVLGVVRQGGQLQVIIGQEVPKLYDEVINLVPSLAGGAVDDDPDGVASKSKEPFSWKKLPSRILGAIVGCLTPILPILIAGGLIKMIVAVFGPSMLGLIPEGSDLLTLLTLVGDAAFASFPIFVAWSGSKQFGCNTVLALFFAALLLYPDFVSIASSGTPFTVYGIPMVETSYSSTVLPMMLITFAMSLLERPLKRYIPTQISTMAVPTLEILIMLPIALCVLGPAGAILGNYLSVFLFWLHDVLGPVGVAIIGSVFLLIVAAGMHLTLLATTLVSLTTIGYDDTVLVGSTAGTYACIAIYLAYFLRVRDAKEKQLGLTVLISQAFGGVGEPGMFGVLFRYPKLVIYEMVATFFGGLWMGINDVKLYFLGSSNFMAAVVFSGADLANLVNGIIGCAIAFVLAFVFTLAFGWEGELHLPAFLARFRKGTKKETVPVPVEPQVDAKGPAATEEQVESA